jgi:hypothetical protein
MGEVRVHLADEIDLLFDGSLDAVNIRPSKAADALAMHDLYPARVPACQLVSHATRAVR